MSTVEITPEPGDAEREAIFAALAAEDAERRRVSEWATVSLQGCEPEEGEP